MDLDQLAARLQSFRTASRWWVAFSGGLDSRVLLDLCWRLCQRPGWPPLAAIHVNHQLSPSAAAWADRCRTLCDELGVPLRVTTVTVAPAGDGIEAAARRARYAAFESVLGEGELLLQAHHADDQAETVLLRLLRGAAPAQLAAIPAERALGRGHLCRPLLGHPRTELATYAAAAGLDWVEDESNADTRFDRNFLRSEVLPRLAERWPDYRQSLAQCAAQADEMQQLLDELAGQDIEQCIADAVLLAERCAAFSAPRQANMLRHWLAARGLPPPGRPQIAALREMLTLPADRVPLVSWPGAEVRRFRGALHAMTPLPPLCHWAPRAWQPPAAVSLPGSGRLEALAVHGSGLRADLPLELRRRVGGERCRPVGRAHSQTLRRLLQEYAVPAWLRDRLPLIYSDGQLAAVADLWVCSEYAAGPDEAGWALRWMPPGEEGATEAS